MSRMERLLMTIPEMIQMIPRSDLSEGSSNVRSRSLLQGTMDRQVLMRDEDVITSALSGLTGAALDFYLGHVAERPERWTCALFYDGLYDYCFPADHRLKVRLTACPTGYRISQSVRK